MNSNITQTILKEAEHIQLGDENYSVQTFSTAKSWLAFELLASIASAVGTPDLFNNLTDVKKIQEAANATTIGKLVQMLPLALKNAKEPVYQLFGLIVTENSQLKEWDLKPVNVGEELFKRGFDIAHDANNEQIIALLTLGSRMLGVESVIKNVVKAWKDETKTESADQS